jgi:hypothetical protein
MDDDGRPLHVLYVGDYDPSGMNMSESDLPKRFAGYDDGRAIGLTGLHVQPRCREGRVFHCDCVSD